MRTLIWRPSAREDLAKIIAYIAERNPPAARHIRNLIEESVLPLAEQPELFRPGRVASTSERVAHPNYIVVYRVTRATAEIINVLHARQRCP